MKEDLCYIQRMEVKFLTDMDPGVATPPKKLIHCKLCYFNHNFGHLSYMLIVYMICQS